MSKNKTLLMLIGVLLITNFVMLYLLTKPVAKEPEISRSERMAKMLQKDLGLDSAQIYKYLELREFRDNQLKPLQQDLRQSKLEMMDLLKLDSISKEQIELAAEKVASKQPPIEVAFFEHFQRLQQMLRPDQKMQFDSLLVRMVNRSTGGNDSADKKQ